MKNQLDIGTETDTLINYIETASQKKVQRPVDSWFLIRKPEIHTGKRTASSTNGTGQNRRLHAGDTERAILSSCTKLYSRPQHEVRCTESGRRESEGQSLVQETTF